VADVSGLHHVGDGADRILNRHCRIPPRRLVEIDVVGAQPPQGVGEKVLHRARATVVAEKLEIGGAQRAELDREKDALALAALERLADQHLIVARAVEVAGVEHAHAGLERGLDGCDGFGVVGGPVAAGHAHAAQTHGGDLRAVSPQWNKPHLLHLPIAGRRF